MSSVPAPERGGIDDLQFQKADVPVTPSEENLTPTCAACTSELGPVLYQFGGANICVECAEKVKEQQRDPDTGLLFRGILFATGTAIACAIGYALIVFITSYEIALLAIAVGYLIGKAARKGANGLGGRKLQIGAVALTYMSITFAYAPLVVKGLWEQMEKEKSKETQAVENKKGEAGKQQAATQDAAKEAPKQEAPPASTKRQSNVSGADLAVSIGIGLAVIAGISLFGPFLGLTQGISGILGVIIVLVGLHEAWKQTRKDPRLLVGPLTANE